MTEIIKAQIIDKGSLYASCDVYFPDTDEEIREIKIFKKNNQRWIGLPAKEFMNRENQKKYKELLVYRSEITKNKRRDEILEAFDKYITQKPTEEVPF